MKDMLKRLLAIILSLMIFLMPITVLAVNSSGACGDNLAWEFDSSTNVLTVSGNGDMKSFSASNPPWDSFKAEIESVVIADGITSLGSYAFYEYNSLKDVFISKSVISVGSGAFSGCISLTNVYYSGSEEEWNTIEIGSNNTCLTDAKVYFNYTGAHICTFNTLAYVQTEHPHYLVYRCSCGKEQVSNIPNKLEKCEICYPMETDFILGDANGDGKISAVDARIVLQVTAGILNLPDNQKQNLDINNDGRVSGLDARIILQISAGIYKK